jgi:hypothetical protein
MPLTKENEIQDEEKSQGQFYGRPKCGPTVRQVVYKLIAGLVVQSVNAAQQFAVPDLLHWRLLKRVLLAKLVSNESCLSSSQAGKLRR